MNQTKNGFCKNSSSQSRPTTILADLIFNDPERKMRVGIKQTEEIVQDETKRRKLHAPPSLEERVLFKR